MSAAPWRSTKKRTRRPSLARACACAWAWAWALGCSPPGDTGALTGAAADGTPANSGAPAGSGASADSGTTADPAAPADAQASGACSLVQTTRGPVLGAASNGGCTYLGIPFAAPPTGALRWKAPQPAAAWTTPRPSAAASACPQTSSEMGEASTNEDCLYLNVRVPVATPTQPAPPTRPVMVFVYGGGFTVGAATVPLYDGTKLASATGAIVVTLNYRLGPFGFLSGAALRAEDPAHPSAGNYGIEDQIAAFQWVKNNAAAFGGDPSNVTIFGESAGGTSLLVHLASPKSAGLFARVIVESAWAMPGATTFTTAAADQDGDKLAQALGCTSQATALSCLRGKSVAEILKATSGGPLSGGPAWAPVIDGFVIPDDPVKVFAKGTFNKVPTVIGDNRNEATLFFYVSGSGMDIPAPTDPVSYWALEELFYPGHGAAIVAEYPIASFQGDYKAAAAEAMGDSVFVCGARRVARALTAAGVPTFRYDFTRPLDLGIAGLGAPHASELPYVFGNPLDPKAPLTPGDLPVVKQVMAYWGSMAMNGDPKTAGQLDWPRYDTTSETQIVLDVTPSTESAFKKAKCDFWDGLGP
jgi:para-nitrobenzyl esterase